MIGIVAFVLLGLASAQTPISCPKAPFWKDGNCFAPGGSSPAPADLLCCSCPAEVLLDQAGNCFSPSPSEADGRIVVAKRCCSGTFPSLVGNEKTPKGLTAKMRDQNLCLRECNNDSSSDCFKRCVLLGLAKPVAQPSASAIAVPAAANAAATVAVAAGATKDQTVAVASKAAAKANAQTANLDKPANGIEKAEVAARAATTAAKDMVGANPPALEAVAADAAAKIVAPEPSSRDTTNDIANELQQAELKAATATDVVIKSELKNEGWSPQTVRLEEGRAARMAVKDVLQTTVRREKRKARKARVAADVHVALLPASGKSAGRVASDAAFESLVRSGAQVQTAEKGAETAARRVKGQPRPQTVLKEAEISGVAAGDAVEKRLKSAGVPNPVVASYVDSAVAHATAGSVVRANAPVPIEGDVAAKVASAVGGAEAAINGASPATVKAAAGDAAVKARSETTKLAVRAKQDTAIALAPASGNTATLVAAHAGAMAVARQGASLEGVQTAAANAAVAAANIATPSTAAAEAKLASVSAADQAALRLGRKGAGLPSIVKASEKAAAQAAADRVERFVNAPLKAKEDVARAVARAAEAMELKAAGAPRMAAREAGYEAGEEAVLDVDRDTLAGVVPPHPFEDGQEPRLGPHTTDALEAAVARLSGRSAPRRSARRRSARRRSARRRSARRQEPEHEPEPEAEAALRADGANRSDCISKCSDLSGDAILDCVDRCL